jgi:hypothetical protein
MKIKSLSLLILLFTSLYCLLDEEKEPFTAEAMHLLNRLSSFVPSPDK